MPNYANVKKMPNVLTMPTPAPSLQERKQQLVRDAIWAAATSLFYEKGYDETTVDDIAEKAGVSRRSFFRYFSSKSDVMTVAVDDYATLLTEAIEACPRSDSLAEVFRRTVLEVARHCASDPHTRKVMQIAARYPAAREALQSGTIGIEQRVAAAFARRCGRGADKDLTASVVAGLALSVLSVIFRVWFEQGKQDVTATVEQVLATLGRLVP
jgi:AcrR family transcriptional regulator